MLLTYRYLILESNQLYLLKDANYLPKEIVFKNILDSIFASKKMEISEKELFYCTKVFSENIYLFQLSTLKFIDHHYAGDDEITKLREENYPFIWIIIDTRRQIILIEDKSSVISVKKARNLLEDFFTSRLIQNELGISIVPRSREKDFWSEVSSMDKITSLDLVISAPNYFKGRHEVEEFVKEQYQDTNFSTLQLKYKSLTGKLKVLKKNIGAFIELISDGGGKYTLSGLIGNEKKIVTSNDLTIKSNLESTEIESITEGELEKELFLVSDEKLNPNVENDSQLYINFEVPFKNVPSSEAENLNEPPLKNQNPKNLQSDESTDN